MKKKSLVLLTFILSFAIFIPKMLDDSKAEKAFDKVLTSSFQKKSSEKIQKVSDLKTTPKQANILINEENFNDVESLDFYHVSINEENLSEPKKVDVEFLNKESAAIPKQVKGYNLPNRSQKVLDSLSASQGQESLSKKVYELDISDPVTVKKIVLEQTVASSKWAAIDIKIRDYSQKSEPTLIAKTKPDYDRISTTQASNEKPKHLDLALEDLPLEEIKVVAQSTKSEAINPVKDELVFFDYSKDVEKSNEGKKAVVSAASQTTVQIAQALKTKVSKGVPPKISDTKKEADKVWNLFADAGATQSKQEIVPSSEQVNKTVKNLIPQTKTSAKIINKRNYKSNLLIKPYVVGTKKSVRNFDIRFSDDSNDILSDSGNGEVNISTKINNEMAIRRSTIVVKDMMPTTIDLVFEEGEDIASVPMISNKKMESILSSQNFRGNEAFLLVELDRGTEDVEIDGKFSGKVFLDSKFKVVNRADSDFNYILFIDAMPGNTIINFLNTKNETISKIIHLQAEEIYFEPNYYREVLADEFDLNEENLLSKSISPLSIDNTDIAGLTFDTKYKKLTLNKYQAGDVLYPLGTRSYLQLSHLRETVFVGRWKNEEVTIPSETYMRFVLGQFSLGSVGTQCLIQINLSKKANSYSLSGKAADRMMGIQTKILDTDGLFYSDFSAESKKIFILGEEQGIINAKIEYIDGSVDHLQSYCSNSTYLVEQL